MGQLLCKRAKIVLVVFWSFTFSLKIKQFSSFSLRVNSLSKTKKWTLYTGIVVFVFKQKNNLFDKKVNFFAKFLDGSVSTNRIRYEKNNHYHWGSRSDRRIRAATAPAPAATQATATAIKVAASTVNVDFLRIEYMVLAKYQHMSILELILIVRQHILLLCKNLLWLLF